MSKPLCTASIRELHTGMKIRDRNGVEGQIVMLDEGWPGGDPDGDCTYAAVFNGKKRVSRIIESTDEIPE
jgi:hypothetical protein